MTRKILCAVLMLSMLLLSFAGCQQSAPASQAPDADSEAPSSSEEAEKEGDEAAESVVLSLTWGDIEEAKVQYWEQYIMDPFVEEHPEVSFDFRNLPNPRDTLKVEISAGNGPDMFVSDGADIAYYASSGLIVNMEPYREQYKWDDLVFEWAITGCEYNGEMYAMPHGSEATMLYYNQDLLDEHGWKLPTTREEFVEVCDAAIAEGIMPIAYGFSGNLDLNQWLYEHYITGVGGKEIYQELFSGETTFTDERIVEAFEAQIADWNAGYWNQGNAGAISVEESRTLWLNEQALFECEGSWLMMESIDPDSVPFEWGCTAWPGMSGDRGPAGGIAFGAAIPITTTAENPDMCAEFLNYWYSEKELQAQATAAGLQTLPVEVDDSLYPADMSEGIKKVLSNQNAIMSAPDYGFGPWAFFPTNCNNYLHDNYDKLLYGTVTLDEFLATAQAELDKDLEEGFVSAMG